MNRTTARLRAGTAITAAVLLSALGIASPAFADVGPVIPATLTTGNLHIFKYKNPAAGGSAGVLGNGAAIASPNTALGSTPVNGVTFTIARVKFDPDGTVATQSSANIDLSSNAGWQQSAQLALLASGLHSGQTIAQVSTYLQTLVVPSGSSTQYYSLNTAIGPNTTGDATPVGGAPTDATDPEVTNDGQAEFSNLPIGLYVVVESGPLTGSAPIKPFLVTVPISTPNVSGSTTWQSNVYAYPKNTISSTVKTVTDDASLVGEQATNLGGLTVAPGQSLKYTLTTPVPAVDNNAYTSAVVSDKLPTQIDVTTTGTSHLAAILASVQVTINGGSPLTVTTDYTAAFASGTLTVTFTSAGLTKLGAATDPRTLAVSFSGIVNTANTTAGQNGAITNGDSTNSPASATFIGGTVPITVSVPVTTPVVSKYALVSLKKFNDRNANGTDDNTSNVADNGTNDQPIVGAVFTLYTNPNTGNVACSTLNYTSGTAYGTTFTTGTDGKISLLLRDNNWADGASAPAVTPVVTYAPCYWLVETQAAPGYELLPTPITVNVTDGTTSGNGVLALAAAANYKSNAGFALPLTGGFGTFVFYAVGGGIITLTVILLIVLGLRRRKEREATA